MRVSALVGQGAGFRAVAAGWYHCCKNQRIPLPDGRGSETLYHSKARTTPAMGLRESGSGTYSTATPNSFGWPQVKSNVI
jgi:hypothetical protein